LEYRAEGYLPEAMMNFLAFLGWNPGDEREIMTKYQLIDAFSLEKVQHSGAGFNEEKLKWFNKEHMKTLFPGASLAGILEHIPPEAKALPGWSKEVLEKIAPVILERISYFGQVAELFYSGELDCFFAEPTYSKEILVPNKSANDITKVHLDALVTMLSSVSAWEKETVKDAVWEYASEKGRAEVLWPMRVALSGREKSPDPFTIAGVIGREKTLQRLSYAKELFTS